MATAIVYKCELFLTFDGANPGDKKGRQLVSLSPMVAGRYPLRVEPPRKPPPPQVPQRDLFRT